MSIRERRRARGWALQILYVWESRGPDSSPQHIMTEFLAERRVAESSRDYIRDLVTAVAEHCDQIDARIQQSLTNWRLPRLSAIDRNILRLAAAEMSYLPEVPRVVSIREAMLLAEKYGTAESARFVNGVLDALFKRLEAEERSDPGGGSR